MPAGSIATILDMDMLHGHVVIFPPWTTLVGMRNALGPNGLQNLSGMVAPERHPDAAVAGVCSLAFRGGPIPLDQRSVLAENPLTRGLSALCQGAKRRSVREGGVRRMSIPSIRLFILSMLFLVVYARGRAARSTAASACGGCVA